MKINIPYTTSNLDNIEILQLTRAIEEWNNSGKVIFKKIGSGGSGCGSLSVVKTHPTDPKNNRCVSTLGYNGRGRNNFIVLGPCNHTGELWKDLVHELGHTIGLDHEHQRSDRGTYVNFVEPPDGFTYERWVRCDIREIDPRPAKGEYNFRSFMHYPLILPTDGHWNIWIGTSAPADRHLFRLTEKGKMQLQKTWPGAKEEWVGTNEGLLSLGTGDLAAIDRLYEAAQERNSQVKVVSMDEICKEIP
jgi:hypothetical protein